MKIANFVTPTGFEQWGIIDDETNTILGSADLEEAYFTFLPLFSKVILPLGMLVVHVTVVGVFSLSSVA